MIRHPDKKYYVDNNIEILTNKSITNSDKK